MSNWKFEAPGGVNDFSNPNKWHEYMSNEAKQIVKDLVSELIGKDSEEITDKDILQNYKYLNYVDPTNLNFEVPENAITIPIIPWEGFPNAVRTRGPWEEFVYDEHDLDGSYRAAEQLGDEDFTAGHFVDRFDRVLHLPVRHRQDEYLEWVVKRNNDGNITKITFVAEGYDYYAELFKSDPKTVVELYREFTGLNSIQVGDLRAPDGIYRVLKDRSIHPQIIAEPGAFNPRNRFNINPGIVHLSHRANSLGAEINLAGVSSLLRHDIDKNKLGIENLRKLLCCSRGGNPNRNSDPLIAGQAYALAEKDQIYTLSNPVGLYIAGVEDRAIRFKGQPVPREWWKVIRGTGLWSDESRVLRLEFEVPENEGSFDDLTIGGLPIKFGGQIAELINVHLFVTVWDREKNTTQHDPIACKSTCCRKKESQVLTYWDSNSSVPKSEILFDDLIDTGNKNLAEKNTMTQPKDEISINTLIDTQAKWMAKR
jgi:hypothetical protein